jgi:hypothetical protein
MRTASFGEGLATIFFMTIVHQHESLVKFPINVVVYFYVLLEGL